MYASKQILWEKNWKEKSIDNNLVLGTATQKTSIYPDAVISDYETIYYFSVDDMNGWGLMQNKGTCNWMATNLHPLPILFMIPPLFDNKSIERLQSQ